MTTFNRYIGLFSILIYFYLLINGKIKVNKQIKYLWLIFLIAFGSGFSNFGTFNFSKLSLFFIQTPIILSVIYSLSMDVFEMIKCLILATFILVALDLSILLLNFEEFRSVNNIVFHDKYNTNSPYSIVGLAILIPFVKNKIELISKKYDLIFLFVFLVHILVSASRTSIFLLPIIYFSTLFIPIIRLKVLTIFIILLPLISPFLSLVLSNLELSSDVVFFQKALNSFQEISINNQNFDQQLISKNWRGFESFLVFDKIFNNNLILSFFGEGLGSYIEVPLNSFSEKIEGLDKISFFHNGFLTILFNSGLIGILIFLYFLFSIFNKIKILNRKVLKIFSVNILLLLLIFTLTSHGIYKPTLSFPLLISLGIILKLITNTQFQK